MSKTVYQTRIEKELLLSSLRLQRKALEAEWEQISIDEQIQAEEWAVEELTKRISQKKARP